MYKSVGWLCWFYLIFSQISHKNEIIWSLTETKLFHFHRIFQNGGGGPPRDPPLGRVGLGLCYRV